MEPTVSTSKPCDGCPTDNPSCHSRQTSASPPFLLGVVEGFYGRPWTFPQRCDLFSMTARWGMNAFMYAPKDDKKHRAAWRVPYTTDELAELKDLIDEAKSNAVEFIYAISPGLDMVYSSDAENNLLLAKLLQVRSLGCESFAVLFDDIDAALQPDDARVFRSFAHAHCAVANNVLRVLAPEGRLLFCPTEYCGAFATPSVQESQYLHTIGRHLKEQIQFLWTGDSVITHEITPESMQQINDIVKRKCVIWDNLHANDYDSRRVYLGPYSGRSHAIMPYIEGILTNPNCEYFANYIPLHTLAAWYRLGPQYHPRTAFSHAVKDWAPHISGLLSRTIVSSTPQSGSPTTSPPPLLVCSSSPSSPPSLSTCTTPADDMSEARSPVRLPSPDAARTASKGLHGGRGRSYGGDEDQDDDDDGVRRELKNSSTSKRRSFSATRYTKRSKSSLVQSPDAVADAMEAVCDMFYLPFELGNSADSFLQQFYNLAHASSQQGDACEFERRLAAFQRRCHDMASFLALLTSHSTNGPPRSGFLADLHPYMWDLRETLAMLSAVCARMSVQHRQHRLQPSSSQQLLTTAADTKSANGLSATSKDSFPQQQQETPCAPPVSAKIRTDGSSTFAFTVTPYHSEPSPTSEMDVDHQSSTTTADDSLSQPNEEMHQTLLNDMGEPLGPNCVTVAASLSSTEPMTSAHPTSPSAVDSHASTGKQAADASSFCSDCDEYSMAPPPPQLEQQQQQSTIMPVVPSSGDEDACVICNSSTDSGSLDASHTNGENHDDIITEESCPVCISDGDMLAKLQRAILPFGREHGTSVVTPLHRVFTIRPFFDTDKLQLFAVCYRSTAPESFKPGGLQSAHDSCEAPQAFGEVHVEPYLTLPTGLVLVLEDNKGVCGYVLGSSNSALFYEQLETSFLPAFQRKYKSLLEAEGSSAFLRDIIETIQTDTTKRRQEEFLTDYPGHFRVVLLPRAQRQGNGARLAHLISKYLREQGCDGIHAAANTKDTSAMNFCSRLNLLQLHSNAGETTLFGRRLAASQ